LHQETSTSAWFQRFTSSFMVMMESTNRLSLEPKKEDTASLLLRKVLKKV
jgi:hypothetical protein